MSSSGFDLASRHQTATLTKYDEGEAATVTEKVTNIQIATHQGVPQRLLSELLARRQPGMARLIFVSRGANPS